MSSIVDRVGAAAGTAFVVLVLTGNTLTESVVGTDESPAGTAADLAAQASSAAVRTGLALELLGMCCLAVFAATVTVAGMRSHGRAPAVAVVLTAVAAATFLAVKIALAAPALAALAAVDTLPDDVLHALVETNGAGFVLSWLPMALFVACAAAVLQRAGLVGRALGSAGVALGALGLLGALVGAASPDHAVPVPFLLGLLWTAVAGLRLSTGRAPRAPRPHGPAALPDSAHERSASAAG